MVPEFVAHVGHGHPGLVWVIAPALLSFLLGLIVGGWGLPDRLRSEDHAETRDT